MSISFSRSVRSLDQDSGRVTLAVLVGAIVLLALWAGWLALKQMPIYETTSEWQIARDGSLLATFPAADFARIRPGQPARLVPASSDDPPGQVVQAKVREVANPRLNHLAANTVRLSIQQSMDSIQQSMDSMTGKPSKDLQNGEVQVIVEQVSPLTALQSAVNQWVK